MDFPEEKFDKDVWKAEVIGRSELFFDLQATLPKELIFERVLLRCGMG